MSQAFKLFRLQQIDSQLDRLKGRLDEIQSALQDDQDLRQANDQSRAAEKSLEAARKALRQAEENVKTQRIKIETTESTLYGGKVRNPKELQDLQNESAALKRYLSVLEDRQLEAMLVEEECTTEFQSAQVDLAAAQVRLAEKQAALLDEQSRLNKDLPRLMEDRQAASSDIPAQEINLYEALRKNRRGIAVSVVKSKTCSACGSTLNAALLDATLTSGQITRCDTCGRILYLG